MVFIELTKEYIKKLIATKARQYSAISTLIITFMIVTPLCGFLFQCSCDWPWSGLDSKCNFYKPDEEHQCPWCASLIIGVFSTGLAIITAVWAATVYPCFFTKEYFIKEVLIRIAFGVTVFVLVAILTAVLAALWQGYLVGVGGYIN